MKKRIENELKKFHADNDNLIIEAVNEKQWKVTFTGAPSTIYEGEVFSLRIKFPENYPIESPEVTFYQPPPVHPHIYSNGHICLNILGEDWSPALTIKSVCLSILSMLSSATEKVKPKDDAIYSASKGADSNPKHTSFFYHDDSV